MYQKRRRILQSNSKELNASKEALHGGAAERAARSRQHKIFNNDTIGYQQLQRWLLSCQADCVHACWKPQVEYGDGVAEYLYAEHHQVSVVNPARIKRYGESKLHRNKTDKADAFLIAEFCLKEQPSLWHPLSAEIKHLRALVRHLP